MPDRVMPRCTSFSLVHENKVARRERATLFIEQMLSASRLQDPADAGTRGVGNQNLVLKFIKASGCLVLRLKNNIASPPTWMACKASQGGPAQSPPAKDHRRTNALLPSILDKAFKGEP